jgi:peptidylprolyl isomerase
MDFFIKASRICLLVFSVHLSLGSALLAQQPDPSEKVIETKSGLKYVDLVEGTGPAVAPGKHITCQYVGKLENGKVFDSSIARGQPFKFIQGVTNLIPGWVEGASTMKEGGKRRLYIPYTLGYGYDGTPDGSIPPISNLIFELEILKVE